jgi:hypothetical protein
MKMGIPVLDELLGEVPHGKALTYYIDPEVEGDIFAMQTLYKNLDNGYKCVYVTSSMSPMSVKNRFKEYGWNVSASLNFSILDAYSGYIGAISEEKYIVSDPSNAKELDEIVCKAIDSNDLIVFGSLSTILDICGEDVLDYMDGWNRYAKLNDSIIIYSFVTWPYPKKVLGRINELSNAVVTVGGIYHRVVLGHYYGILKSDWVEVKRRAVLFKLLKPGGVRAYIPKILVTGPYNAGKSSFVHAVSTRAVSVDRLGTTVALDHGHVDYKGFSIDVFGTPGQERFNPILKVLGGESLGVILVVDSTKPKTFLRAKQMLEDTTRFGLPYVIAANKQDIKGALSPEDIQKKMSLPGDVPIIRTVATKGEGVFDVLDVLLNLLVGGRNG